MRDFQDKDGALLFEACLLATQDLLSAVVEIPTFARLIAEEGLTIAQLSQAIATLKKVSDSLKTFQRFEESEKLEELRAYCRTVRKASDREVRDGDEVSGYWQTEDWIDGLLELCQEGE